LYLHTTSARGHLRANIEHNDRVCFEIDEQAGVFELWPVRMRLRPGYRSVCLFGRIRIVEDNDTRQRFCEALMDKYGKPERHAEGLLPAARCHHRLCDRRRAHHWQGNAAATAFGTVPRRTARRHPTLRACGLIFVGLHNTTSARKSTEAALVAARARDATQSQCTMARANIALLAPRPY